MEYCCLGWFLWSIYKGNIRADGYVLEAKMLLDADIYTVAQLSKQWFPQIQLIPINKKVLKKLKNN